MEADTSARQASRGLVLPWGWLSLALTVVRISSLGTLAVVAKKEGADTLSTIALALAVLSFSAQLIVSLAQAFNGTQQVAQADRVNADTRASLAAISATSASLLSNQREQFTEVLHAALKIAVPAAVQDVEEAGSTDEGRDSLVQVGEDSIKNLEERLSVRINEALRDIRTGNVSPDIPRTGQTYAKMSRYPGETRGMQLLNILNELTPQESAVFTRWATSTLEIAATHESDIVPGLMLRGRTSPELDRLEELGLVSIKKRDGGVANKRSAIVKLTPLGVEVASLILGQGARPSWLEAANATRK